MTRFRLLVVIALGVCATRVPVAAQTPDRPVERIRVNDSISIRVAGQPNITGLYQVQADGTVWIPLVGVVPVVNQTVPAFRDFVRVRLEPFIKNPDVRVDLERVSKVFVLGEVKAPGDIPLTTGLTVVEALAQAGYTGSGEVLIVRRPGAVGPVLPDSAAPSEIIRVNLRELERAAEAGDLSRNLLLYTNDTIFVPQVDPTLVYVGGHVRKPGKYSVADGVTVLQLVTMAGGATDDGALNRVELTRLTDGPSSRHAGLTETVKPGDLIAVPEQFKLPTVFSIPSTEDAASRRTPFRLLLGSNVALMPSFELSHVGVDTVVFSGRDQLEAVPIAMFGPSLGMSVRTTHFTVDLSGRLSSTVFPTRPGNNSMEPGYGISPSLTAAAWLTLRSQWSMNYRRERWSTEVDLPARRREEARSAGFTVGPFWGVRFLGDVSDLQTTFDADQILYGVDLRQTLSERVQSAVAGVQFSVTSNTALTLSGGRATHRFVLLPDRDANSSELSADLSFKTGAAISGEALVKWVQYVPLDRTVDAYDGPAGRISLSRSFWSRTAIGGLAERATGSSFAPQFAFSVIDRTGGWIQQVLSRRFDVVVEAFRERYLNRAFRTTPAGVRGAPLVWADSDGRRYTAQLGLRVGPARVASHLSATERVNPAAFQGVVFWVDVSYGVFQVRSR